MNGAACVSVPGPRWFVLISDKESSLFLKVFVLKNYLGYSHTVILPQKFYNQLDKLHLKNPIGLFPETAKNV